MKHNFATKYFDGLSAQRFADDWLQKIYNSSEDFEIVGYTASSDGLYITVKFN